MILRDDIAYHRKFLLAGELIGGPAGAARALAVWIAAIGYARTGLTDGIVHDAFLTKFSQDRDAKVIGRVLASTRVRLFHRVRGGYKIHDFDEHNESTDKLRHRRDLARERQRRHRARQPVENSNGGEPTDRVTLLVTRDKGVTSRARVEKEKEKDKEVRTGTSPVRSVSPLTEVPKREQRPGGRDLSPSVKISENRKDELARTPAADGNYAVLVRLAHAVMDDVHEGDPTSPDVIEAVKSAAGARHIPYHFDTLNRALRSAAAQRLTGRGQPQSAGPLAPMVDMVRGAIRDKSPEVLRNMVGARRR